MRNASIDQAVIDYRASLATATPLAKPVVTVPIFGNTDIFGIRLPDLTP